MLASVLFRFDRFSYYGPPKQALLTITLRFLFVLFSKTPYSFCHLKNKRLQVSVIQPLLWICRHPTFRPGSAGSKQWQVEWNKITIK